MGAHLFDQGRKTIAKEIASEDVSALTSGRKKTIVLYIIQTLNELYNKII